MRRAAPEDGPAVSRRQGLAVLVAMMFAVALALAGQRHDREGLVVMGLVAFVVLGLAVVARPRGQGETGGLDAEAPGDGGSDGDGGD